jgi:hypothetical protein
MDKLKGLLSMNFQDVPADMEICETDCRRNDCSESEWEACERRLESVARREASEKNAASDEGTKVVVD